MKARAPGKLVVSGAYAVLRGAPSLVAAVDRYVVADDRAQADFETPEVAAWLQLSGRGGPHPSFDASALRDDGQKLGLGSSAAILAASALVVLGPSAPELSAPDELFAHLRAAHRRAQGGGSGIDVAAAWFGGVVRAQLDDGRLEVVRTSLPPGLCFEVWSWGSPSSTSDFVARVFALESSAPREFARRLGAQRDASERAADALERGDAADFVQALRAQERALRELGELARLPLVVAPAQELCALSSQEAAFLPSGAGGGDVSLFVGPRPSPPEWRRRALELGLRLVPLSLGAPGASFVD